MKFLYYYFVQLCCTLLMDAYPHTSCKNVYTNNWFETCFSKLKSYHSFWEETGNRPAAELWLPSAPFAMNCNHKLPSIWYHVLVWLYSKSTLLVVLINPVKWGINYSSPNYRHIRFQITSYQGVSINHNLNLPSASDKKSCFSLWQLKFCRQSNDKSL